MWAQRSLSPQRHTLRVRDSPQLPGPADGLQSDAVIVEKRQSPSHGCTFSVEDRDPVQGHGPRSCPTSCPTSMKGHSALWKLPVVVWSQPVLHLGAFSGCSDGSTDRFYFSHRLNARENPSCHTASMEPNTDTKSNPGLSVQYPLHLNTLFFMNPPKFLNLTTAPHATATPRCHGDPLSCFVRRDFLLLLVLRPPFTPS